MGIVLPHRFSPRPYQLPVLGALDRGATRAVAVWHRRSGKEKTFVNLMAKRTAQRVGAYYYLFPTFTQAKRAIWDGRDRDGFRFIDHFPDDYVTNRNESELKLTLASGSIFQLVGTDNFDGIMSSNPIGCVFAEYSLQDPRAWDYIRPILRENGGWAVFDYTPRGKNHGKTLFDTASKLQAEGDPAWYCEKLTIADTGVLTEADMDAERREGMSEDMIQQEYFCSFEGVQHGSIYGRQMEQAEADGRICGVPWQPHLPVSTWWDIGTGDATAIWFTQTVGREVHVIDYYENAGAGIGVDHYIRHLQNLPYLWGKHHGPHDLRSHSFAALGKSAFEVAESMGFRFDVIPPASGRGGVSLADGIDAGRAFIARCWFDRIKTERGRKALEAYHYAYDEKRKMFQDAPYHDWSSHAADGWRYLAIGYAPDSVRRQDDSKKWSMSNTRESAGDTAWMGS